MLGCKAIAGSDGVAVAVIDIGKVTDWIRHDGLTLFQELGAKAGTLKRPLPSIISNSGITSSRTAFRDCGCCFLC